MFKYIINCTFLCCLFFVVFLFSSENNNVMLLNLFPFKTLIEIPVYLYTILLGFTSFVLGVISNKIYEKTKNFRKKRN